MIGSLGKLIFNVSSNQIKTFKNLNINKSTRYGKHETLQGKPKLEFTGEDLTDIDLTLSFRIEDKVNPEMEIEILDKARRDGEIVNFILGGKRVEGGRYVITSVGKPIKRVDNRGNILAVDYSIKLQEYIVSPGHKEPVKAESSTMSPINPTSLINPP